MLLGNDCPAPRRSGNRDEGTSSDSDLVGFAGPEVLGNAPIQQSLPGQRRGLIPARNLKSVELGWLLAQGLSPAAIIHPTSIKIARGIKSSDGVFENDEVGQDWFAFDNLTDTVYWQPKIEELACENGRAFALGEELVGNPGVTALDGYLKIYADPLDWLKAERQGVVVLRWDWAFEWLRDVERVAIDERLLDIYRRSMKPRLPQLAVLPKLDGYIG